MSTDRIVVVGVDGSAGSTVALRWALDHADQLGAIEPVMTFVAGPLEHGLAEAAGPDGPGDPYRVEAVRRLRHLLVANAPALLEAGVVIEQRAGPGLVKAARSAELLVLGARGSSSRLDRSLGSVGAYCARHASVPVAVVPREIPTIHDHLDVVVGVDGSVHSLSALRWVLTHLRRSARVTAVRAYAGHGVVGEPLTTAADAAAAAARSELEQEVASVLTDLPGRPPEVQLAVASGDPRAVLRTVGGDADLLVVGARGHGVLDHLLLGSVADALVHHPTVPTILVPDGAARTPGA